MEKLYASKTFLKMAGGRPWRHHEGATAPPPPNGFLIIFPNRLEPRSFFFFQWVEVVTSDAFFLFFLFQAT